MNKNYIKSQIAMRQSEFPTDIMARAQQLPIDSGRIITIPGVRRCGKSSRMEYVVNALLEAGVERRRILWVSFDDERLVRMSSDQLHVIIEAYSEMYPDIDMKSVYVFFDEIQLVDGWEYFVMKLYKHYTRNIYISGSNASMLSTELKSALRGWPLEEETMPLSFTEYCGFKKIDTNSWLEQDLARIKNAFASYNNEGGFPEVVLTENSLLRTRILQTYFDTMLLKDLAEHYRLSNIEVLRYLLKRVMSNLTKPTSVNALHGDIKSRGLKVSKDHLYDWINYACNIFMFYRVSKFSRSLQKVESSLPKYYCIDNGLRDAVLLPHSDDDGKKLENTVFLELYRRATANEKIYYYQDRGECDFVVEQSGEVQTLIQVCWSLNDDETRRREISGLLEAYDALSGSDLLILTNDEEETIVTETGVKINVKPVWKWLLGR